MYRQYCLLPAPKHIKKLSLPFDVQHPLPTDLFELSLSEVHVSCIVVSQCIRWIGFDCRLIITDGVYEVTHELKIKKKTIQVKILAVVVLLWMSIIPLEWLVIALSKNYLACFSKLPDRLVKHSQFPNW